MPNINNQINRKLIPFSIDLMRIESGLARIMLKDFRKLEKELVAELISVDPVGVKRTAYQEARLQALLKQVRVTIKSYFKKSYLASQKELTSLVDLTDKTLRGAVNTTVGANLATTAISPVQAAAISDGTAIAGLRAKEWFGKIYDDSVRLYEGAIREGMTKGETMPQIVNRVIGTRGKAFKDGMTKQVKTRITAMARTLVQNVSNTARLNVYKNNKNILNGITWVSTLDNRTTIICMALDGLSWDNNLKPINHDTQFVGATAHFACRSTQVPLLKSYDEMPAKIKKKIPEGKRASMDGEVAEKTTYEDFLRRKEKTNPAFAKKQLGATKYRLWKEKKITFTDLIDQKGNPVSVAELLQDFDKAA